MAIRKRGRSRSKTAGTSFEREAVSAGLSALPGLAAVQGTYRSSITTSAGAAFTGSVDMDQHFLASEPHANRWDYGVGICARNVEMAFWVEPHPASSTGEVDVMLRKLAWIKDKLGQTQYSELKARTDHAAKDGRVPYRWLASGSIRIRAGSADALRLAKAGLAMPARQVTLP